MPILRPARGSKLPPLSPNGLRLISWASILCCRCRKLRGILAFELLDFQSTQLNGELCRLQLGGRRRQFALAGQGKSPQYVRVAGKIGRGQRHTLPLSNGTEDD